MQLDWTLKPYSIDDWLRLPPLQDLDHEPEDLAPLTERRQARKRSLVRRWRLTRAESKEKDLIRVERVPVLPTWRWQCAGVPRPCPFVSCKHHLYLDVSPDSGAIILNFPELHPWEMTESCSLDKADKVAASGRLLDMVPLARLMNLTVQRIHQIRDQALLEVKAKASEPVQVEQGSKI